MTATLIYAVKQDEPPVLIGETENSFRGAMYVWNDIAVRYFDLEYFPHFDDGMQRRIWNAGNEKPLTEAELIVLASTMDKAVVSHCGIDKLVAAFNEYAAYNEYSSFKEQAALIGAASIDDGYAVAWNQTSVCSDCWFDVRDDDMKTCDLSRAFDVIEQVSALRIPESKGQ
ncbi:hypothetical protein ACTG16_21840 [Aeromonas sp. 23P]|uniref:hypothetical protein n=1 Tax=Aeromonas sp. 23P TaxID=3452716 RepID=UPI003F7916E7